MSTFDSHQNKENTFNWYLYHSHIPPIVFQQKLMFVFHISFYCCIISVKIDALRSRWILWLNTFLWFERNNFHLLHPNAALHLLADSVTIINPSHIAFSHKNKLLTSITRLDAMKDVSSESFISIFCHCKTVSKWPLNWLFILPENDTTRDAKRKEKN